MQFIRSVAGYGSAVAIAAALAVALMWASPMGNAEAAAYGGSPSYGEEQASFTLVVEPGGAQIPGEATFKVAATVETLNDATVLSLEFFTFDEQGQLIPATITGLIDVNESSGLQLAVATRNDTVLGGVSDVIVAITNVADGAQATTSTSSVTIDTETTSQHGIAFTVALGQGSVQLLIMSTVLVVIIAASSQFRHAIFVGIRVLFGRRAGGVALSAFALAVVLLLGSTTTAYAGSAGLVGEGGMGPWSMTVLFASVLALLAGTYAVTRGRERDPYTT